MSLQSFIGIMVLSARHVNKNEQEAKDLSKTSIVDDNDNGTRGQLNFPVQQAIIGQNWDSVSINLSPAESLCNCR